MIKSRVALYQKLMSPGVLFVRKISYLYQKQHRVGTMLLYYSYVTFQYCKDFLQLCHSAQLRSTSVLFILLLMISSSQCHFQNSLKTALYY